MTIRERFGGMRLSTRLRLAFAIVAALPIMVVPAVLRAVTQSYDRAFARDLEDSASLVSDEIRLLGSDVLTRVKLFADGPVVEELVFGAGETDGAPPAGLSEDAFAQSGLDVLEVVDEAGRIVISGHLPARLGDLDPLPGKAIRVSDGHAVLAEVEVRKGEEIVQARALVVAVRTAGDHPLTVLGGKLFGDDRLARLSDVVRGDVTFTTEATAAAPGAERWRRKIFGQARTFRDVEIGAVDGPRRIRIKLSDDALVDAKARIVGGALVAFALALVVGVVLAALLARGLVGPVGSLVAGTERIAAGEFGHKVEADASGEMARLVDAFNRMSEEISRGRERLAQAERIAAWEQIARGLAHEIKNPLTPIAMAVETLQRSYDRKHPEFEKFFREGTATVLEEVQRLKRLASEFGEFARWPKPVVVPASAADIVRNAAALYASPPPGIEVSVEAAEGLPTLEVDLDQLQRALVNLVKNGIEAMPNGGKIVLRAALRDDAVAIEVADNGTGLSPEVRQNLFQPYVTTKTEGTGLGLAIVHRIVVEHGGRIEVVETPGGGTTFRILLPPRIAGTPKS